MVGRYLAVALDLAIRQYLATSYANTKMTTGFRDLKLFVVIYSLFMCQNEDDIEDENQRFGSLGK